MIYDTNSNINNMVIMELLTLKAPKQMAIESHICKTMWLTGEKSLILALALSDCVAEE